MGKVLVCDNIQGDWMLLHVQYEIEQPVVWVWWMHSDTFMLMTWKSDGLTFSACSSKRS